MQEQLRAAIEGGARVIVDLMYGDYEGGQRTIARFGLNAGSEGRRAEIIRYWNVDRPDPRER